MAKKEYVFPHNYDAATAVIKVRPFIDKLAKMYHMDMQIVSPTSFALTTSGARADITLMDKEMKAEVELSFMFEKLVRAQLEEALEKKLRPLLEEA